MTLSVNARPSPAGALSAYRQSAADSAEHVPLCELMMELRQFIGRQPPPNGYRLALSLVQNGQIAAVREGSRIYVPKSELPEVARKLGMVEIA